MSLISTVLNETSYMHKDYTFLSSLLFIDTRHCSPCFPCKYMHPDCLYLKKKKNNNNKRLLFTMIPQVLCKGKYTKYTVQSELMVTYLLLLPNTGLLQTYLQLISITKRSWLYCCCCLLLVLISV